MTKFNELLKIFEILIFILEVVTEDAAKPAGTVLEQKKMVDEIRHQKAGIKIIETTKNRLFKETHILEVSDDSTLQTTYFGNENLFPLQQSKYSQSPTDECKLGNNRYLTRHSRSISSTNVSTPKFKHVCENFADQPCTCNYPDHPSVTRFEIDSDDTTQNASDINGTGPASCEELQSFGYHLEGFYLVRFKPKRVQAIYCGFNQTIQNLGKNNRPTKSNLKHGDAGSSQKGKFCNGHQSESQTCTFLYPDYPDVPLFNLEKNKNASISNISRNKNALGPTSCDDLQRIGHKFKGFYMIRRNALKIKIIYCDFSPITLASKGKRPKRSTPKKNGTTSPKNVTQVCTGIGSQPCSCYYSNFSEILQFELSDDEITRKAMHEKGTGPSTCEELQKFGHTLNGFYFLKLNNISKIKTRYCKLNETKRKPENKKKRKNESRTSTVPIPLSSDEDQNDQFHYLASRNMKTSTTLHSNKIMSSLTLTTKMPLYRSSNSSDKLFHLKNEWQNICMGIKDGTQYQLILRTCDNSSSVLWFKDPVPENIKTDGTTQLQHTSGDKLLAVHLKSPDGVYKISVRPYQNQRNQQWKMLKTGQLKNVEAQLCLTIHSKTLPNKSTKWTYGMENCSNKRKEIAQQKWSVVPLPKYARS